MSSDFIAKEIFVQLQENYKETKLDEFILARYSNSTVLKMVANLIKYIWQLTGFYCDACFFFCFLFVNYV